MSITVTLGGMTLEAFEVPAAIHFGGSQRMAVHDMPGGGRVIDLLGAVAADIAFDGVISGSDADIRAGQLDAMRASGAVFVLSWGGRYYTVILREASFDYAKPWWIPYRLRCVVQGDFSFGPSQAVDSAAADIAADLANAGGFLAGLPIPGLAVSLGVLNAALAVTGATSFGTAAYGQGLTAMTSALGAVSGAIASVGAPLPGLDLGDSGGGVETSAMIAMVTTAATTAGSLTALTSAQGSLGRAYSTLQTIGT